MRFLVLLSILFTQTWVYAQRPVNSQLVVNPSLYNPAYVGYHQRSEVLVGYQQQWLGINEAPSLASFQYHAAFTRHLGLGLQATRQTVGQLQRNQANLLFSYQVLLGQEARLSFGLSGGIAQTGLNQQATYNPLDPAVNGLLSNTLVPQAAFGTSLQFSDFNVGIALPELLPITNEVLSDVVSSKPYDQIVVNVDYRFTVPNGSIALRPYIFHHQDKSAPSVTEGGSLFYFQEVVYVGGGYRLNYGPTVMAGVQFSDFKLGYNYEHPTSVVNQIGQGGHELQLSYQFGKKPSQNKKQVVSDPYPLPPSDSTETAPITEDIETEQQKKDESQHAIFYRGNHPEELGVGFYVIAGSFENQNFARQQVKEISKQGTFAGVGYNSQRAYYYIFIYRSGDLEKTREARDKHRQNPVFQDAWLLEIKDR